VPPLILRASGAMPEYHPRSAKVLLPNLSVQIPRGLVRGVALVGHGRSSTKQGLSIALVTPTISGPQALRARP